MVDYLLLGMGRRGVVYIALQKFNCTIICIFCSKLVLRFALLIGFCVLDILLRVRELSCMGDSMSSPNRDTHYLEKLNETVNEWLQS